VKTIIENLNKAFENRIRLGAMSALMVNESMDFNGLKELLDVTDGNLASHISALEKAGYVDVRKVFIGKKPNTSYAASNEGRKAFKEHLDALETLIRNNSGL
jgi:DNA-binding MarR family transcriptional regulator